MKGRDGILTLLLTALPGLALGAEPVPTWVFFEDKGLRAEEVEDALAQRAATLSPRALDRRRRHRGAMETAVDIRDLDPSPEYVTAVLATGGRHRSSSRWLNAISIWAGPSEVTAIEALPFVRRTEPVARHNRPGQPLQCGGSIPWCPSARSGAGSSRDRGSRAEPYGVALEQLELLGVPALHRCGLTGAGVVVGVQDTGFVLDHEAFRHLRVLAARDFINDDDTVANEDGDPDDQHNHGTSVLSLLAGWDWEDYVGVAPEVTVILAKTEDASQEEPIEEDWFVEGLEWIESLGADVFTASLGYFDWYGPEDMDGQTAVTTIAANVAIENGLIMLAAAGNEGPGETTLIAPADADGLITVGAVDLDGTIADFSSRGPTADGRIKPDICAMGVQNWVVDPATTDGYEQGNGTSYATPMAAGLVALLKQAYPELGPGQMHGLLTSTACHSSAPDNDYGWGVPSGVDAAGLYCSCHDADGDGHYDLDCGGDDCDDVREEVYPGAEEICDGHDDDCDGELDPGEHDEDDDGVLECAGDCDDDDEDVYPDAEEICDDGVDNDCDGDDDEDDSDCPSPDPPGAPGASDPSDAGSCDCRQAPSGGPTGLLGWAAALLVALTRRGRRRGSRSASLGTRRSR